MQVPMRKTSFLLLLSASLIGCATDGSDSAGSGGGAGGKADGDEGLHVVAKVTKLSDQNSIRWPQAVDAHSTVDDTINAQLKFEDLTYGENLDEIKRAWAAAMPDEVIFGVQSTDFEVTANMRNVLSLSVSIETMAAYPDMFYAYKNFNNLTGAAVKITDLLDASKLPAVASKLDEELQRRIATLEMEIQSGEVQADQWDSLHVTAADLESFSTTPEGITFHYDPGFPHAIQALE